jgi:predicted AAA+ superfamily ATPase
MLISLLDSEYFQRYLTETSLFSREMTAKLKSKAQQDTLVVAVDEVQKLPMLLDEVHLLIEKYKGQLVFLLTGSSARKLRRSGANLLAARALTTYLHPLSVLEFIWSRTLPSSACVRISAHTSKKKFRKNLWSGKLIDLLVFWILPGN